MARSRPLFGRRRSPAPIVFVALGGLLASVGAIAAIGANSASATPTAAAAPAAAEPDVAERRPHAADEAAPGGAETQPPAFARVGGLSLAVPADDVIVLGFHESATRETVALEPIGTVVDHQNTTKFDPPPAAPDGTDYVVMSSRGRPMPATSAADLVLAEGTPVRAPVDGRVSDVREYYLYGKHLDHRIEIVPDAAPDVRIVMIHVDGASVAAGDRVVAGETIVSAQARRFPFSSHIDRYTEPERHGHVHLEVQQVDAPRPGDDLTDTADGAAASG